jgi:hypothetical protein
VYATQYDTATNYSEINKINISLGGGGYDGKISLTQERAP